MLPENNIRFKPFEVKSGMTVAPRWRRELSLDLKNCLDEGLRNQVCLSKKLCDRSSSSLYLSQKLRYIDDQYTLSKGTIFIYEMKAQVISDKLPVSPFNLLCIIMLLLSESESVFNMNRDVAREKFSRFLIS